MTNNVVDVITVSANGDFAFPVPLADGSPYIVTVIQQPTVPIQTCTSTNAFGTLNGASIANIRFICVATPLAVSLRVVGDDGAAVGTGGLVVGAMRYVIADVTALTGSDRYELRVNGVLIHCCTPQSSNKTFLTQSIPNNILNANSPTPTFTFVARLISGGTTVESLPVVVRNFGVNYVGKTSMFNLVSPTGRPNDDAVVSYGTYLPIFTGESLQRLFGVHFVSALDPTQTFRQTTVLEWRFPAQTVTFDNGPVTLFMSGYFGGPAGAQMTVNWLNAAGRNFRQTLPISNNAPAQTLSGDSGSYNVPAEAVTAIVQLELASSLGLGPPSVADGLNAQWLVKPTCDPLVTCTAK